MGIDGLPIFTASVFSNIRQLETNETIIEYLYFMISKRSRYSDYRQIFGII